MRSHCESQNIHPHGMARKYPSDPVVHAKTMRKEPNVRAGFPAMRADGPWERATFSRLEIATGVAHISAKPRKAGYFACSGFFISRNQASALPGRTRASLLKKSSANTRSSPEVQPS